MGYVAVRLRRQQRKVNERTARNLNPNPSPTPQVHRAPRRVRSLEQQDNNENKRERERPKPKYGPRPDAGRPTTAIRAYILYVACGGAMLRVVAASGGEWREPLGSLPPP